MPKEKERPGAEISGISIRQSRRELEEKIKRPSEREDEDYQASVYWLAKELLRRSRIFNKSPKELLDSISEELDSLAQNPSITVSRWREREAPEVNERREKLREFIQQKIGKVSQATPKKICQLLQKGQHDELANLYGIPREPGEVGHKAYEKIRQDLSFLRAELGLGSTRERVSRRRYLLLERILKAKPENRGKSDQEIWKGANPKEIVELLKLEQNKDIRDLYDIDNDSDLYYKVQQDLYMMRKILRFNY